MKFKTNKEFRDTFIEAFHETSNTPNGDRELSEYEFLDVYLQVAECKRVLLRNQQYQLYVPNYDTQLYEVGFRALLKQLYALSELCNYTLVASWYKSFPMIEILESSIYVQESQLPDFNLILTNQGVLDVFTKEITELSDDQIFTTLHYIGETSLRNQSYRKIEELFKVIAGNDKQLLKQIYLIAYYTLLGQGNEHITFLTGEYSPSKDMLILLLKTLASKQSNADFSLRSMAKDDHIYLMPQGRALLCGETSSSDLRPGTSSKDHMLSIVRNMPFIITDPKNVAMTFQHLGMNVHSVDDIPEKFVTMHRFHPFIWELRIPRLTRLTSTQTLRNVANEVGAQRDQLMYHPQFEAKLISTVLKNVDISSSDEYLRSIDDITSYAQYCRDDNDVQETNQV